MPGRFLVLLFSFFHFLSAQVLPKIVPLPDEIRLNRGQRYLVTCATSQGDLPLNFHWLRNSQPLITNSRLSIRRQSDFASALLIPSVSTDDSDNFTCIASNMAGSDSFVTRLLVMVPPEWMRQPYDQSALKGQKVVLHCEVSGYPQPILTWIKDGRPVGGQWRMVEKGQLSNPSVRQEDEGTYTCMADNGLGHALTKTVTVQVQVGPTISFNITRPSIRRGDRIELRCDVSGDQPIRITWKFRDTRLTDGSKDNRVRIQEQMWGSSNLTSYVVMEAARPEDTGVYACMVQNNVGIETRQGLVLVTDIPQKPERLKILRVWSKSVHLKWQIPDSGNQPIKQYRVTYKIKGEFREQEFVTTGTKVKLKNLRPFTEYLVFVEAENEMGRSPPSNPLPFATEKEEPAAPSTDLKLEDRFADALKISWRIPPKTEWHGDLQGFLVGCRRSGSDTNYIFTKVAPDWEKSRQFFTISQLRPSTNYRIVLRAFNSAGLGPPTPTISAKTTPADPPSIPSLEILTTYHHSVKIKIEAEPSTLMMLHLRDPRSDWIKIPLLNMETVVGGLASGVNYQAYVTSQNSIAQSGPSETVNFYTDQQRKALFFFSDMEPDAFYLKLSFVVPIAVSVTIIIILPLVACCLLHKLKTQRPTALINPRNGKGVNSDGVKAPGFTYTSTSLPHALPRRNPSENNMHNMQRPHSALIPYPVYGDAEDHKYDAVDDLRTFIRK